MDEHGASISIHFSQLEEPRAAHLVEHKLIDVIVIAICAVLSGAETWTDIALFGRERQEWLGQFLELPQGTPSHDTFGRVFSLLDPEQFEQCFRSWVTSVFAATTGEVVAIDGKTMRRSHDRSCGQSAIHLVSAWASGSHLVLGQRKVDEKSNEITAIPELLAMLRLNGCLVTIDAIGTQTAIAERIIQQEADYVLPVKENQPHLLEDIELFFRLAEQNDFTKVDYTFAETLNKGHGRIEKRQCWTIAGDESLQFLRGHGNWPALRSITMVRYQRQTAEKKTTQERYFLSSLENDAPLLLDAVRSHGGIENSLHWLLDVAFREDDNRVCKQHAPENMALLRRIALNLLKQEKSLQRGIQGKRLKAALNPGYLLKVLQPT